MPSVKQSQNANMNGWTQQPPKTDTSNLQKSDQASEPPATGGYPNMSPFMLSSMPLMAATNDALTQFYGDFSIPQFRTVPMQHGGNS
jgi:hypothetical protein